MAERRAPDSRVVAALGCAAIVLLGLALSAAAASFWMRAQAPGLTAPVTSPPPAPPPTPPPAPALPPPPAPPAPPIVPTPRPPPRIVRATVVEVEGSVRTPVGALCAFTVDPRERPDLAPWCNAQIVCDGQLLYGGPEAGYFPCELSELPRRDVSGRDEGTTRDDGDAAMALDTRAGTLEIRDDETGALGRFRVTARVDSVE